MEHQISKLLGYFLGLQEEFPADGGHHFMGFDLAETRVFVTQIPKANHQQPLERRCTSLERFHPAVTRVQFSDQLLERQALFEQWAQGLGDQAIRASGLPIVSGEIFRLTMMEGYMDAKSIWATSL